MKINQRYHFDEDYVINVEPMMKTAIDNKRADEEAVEREIAESKAHYEATLIVENMINKFIDHFLNNPGRDSSIYSRSDLLAHLDEEDVARYIVLDLKANASVPDDLIVDAAISIGNKLSHRPSSRICKIATEIERIANSFIIGDNIAKSMQKDKSQTTTYTDPQFDGFYVSTGSNYFDDSFVGSQLINTSHLNGSMSGIDNSSHLNDSTNDAAYRRHLDDTYCSPIQS